MTEIAGQELMTPREVATAFMVNPKTVARWASEGRLTRVRTLGGHSRFIRSEVDAMLAATRTGPGVGAA